MFLLSKLLTTGFVVVILGVLTSVKCDILVHIERAQHFKNVGQSFDRSNLIVVDVFTTRPYSLHLTWMKVVDAGPIPIVKADNEFVTSCLRSEQYSAGLSKYGYAFKCVMEYRIDIQAHGTANNYDAKAESWRQLELQINIENNAVVRLARLNELGEGGHMQNYFSVFRTGYKSTNPYRQLITVGEYRVSQHYLDNDGPNGTWYYRDESPTQTQSFDFTGTNAEVLQDGIDGTHITFNNTKAGHATHVRALLVKDKDSHSNLVPSGIYVYELSSEHLIFQTTVSVISAWSGVFVVRKFESCDSDIVGDSGITNFDIAATNKLAKTCIKFLITGNPRDRHEYTITGPNNRKGNPSLFKIPAGVSDSQFLYLSQEEGFEEGKYLLEGRYLDSRVTFEFWIE